MRTRRWSTALAVTSVGLVAVVGSTGLAGLAGLAGAAEPSDGPAGPAPSLALDRSELRPGERVVVTLSDWPGRAVILSVCGNAAARGSSDCDMVASLGVSLARTGSTTLAELVVVAPPGTCPCVVRASDTTHDRVATVPVAIEGVPVGPVVGPAAGRPLGVAVAARPAPAGWLDRLRSSVGGPTAYEVTVVVENRSAEPVRNLALAGSAVRGGTDDVASLVLDPPAELAPGETWEQVVRATLPAPVWGRVVWEVNASGAGPTAQAEVATRRTPVVLVVLAVLLVVDLVAMVVRARRRRRRRRRAEAREGEGVAPGPAAVVHREVAVPSPPVPARSSRSAYLPR